LFILAPMSSISQLQMSYSAEQDRILLRVNTKTGEEFRFWLTRRYARLIIKALKAHRAADPDVSSQVTPDAKKAVQEFKQEAAQAKGNFKKDFEPSGQFPLGEEPTLAFKLSYSVKNGKLALAIAPKESQGINLVLDENLNFNVTRLLRSAATSGDWQLDWGEDEPETTAGRVIN
jgi:hypothetical protein